MPTLILTDVERAVTLLHNVDKFLKRMFAIMYVGSDYKASILWRGGSGGLNTAGALSLRNSPLVHKSQSNNPRGLHGLYKGNFHFFYFKISFMIKIDRV